MDCLDSGILGDGSGETKLEAAELGLADMAIMLELDSQDSEFSLEHSTLQRMGEGQVGVLVAPPAPEPENEDRLPIGLSRPGRTFRDENDFRRLSLIPRITELFKEEPNFLRENVISGAYDDMEHYLDVHFRLIREDFLRSVKFGLQRYVNQTKEPPSYVRKPNSGIKVYDTIELIGKFDENICQLKVPEELMEMLKSSSDFSRTFMNGSLLLFTNNNFNYIYSGVVCNNPQAVFEDSGAFFVKIEPFKRIPVNLPWPAGKGEKFLTVECEAYFQPNRKIMGVLKEINFLDKMSIGKLLLNGSGPLVTPAYLEDKPLFVGGMEVGVKDTTVWPKILGLDEAQFRAYKSSLSQEFSIIQGPPGTGKTFLGLEIIKTLMDARNKPLWRANGGGPIIIMTYTNHALDQFGECILDVFTPPDKRKDRSYIVSEPKIYRVGFGCKSPRLLKYKPATTVWSSGAVDILLMTSSWAAMKTCQLGALKSKIMIVEEAAQIMEACITCCLTPHLQQLILLGDHQQLRAITCTIELTRKYRLDMSLFERMVGNGFPSVQLEVQHRMHPIIRELITGTIYPTLLDHKKVSRYPEVKGMGGRLHFLDHEEPETGPEDFSHSLSNRHEAQVLASLCTYLLGQGYEPYEITVLGLYMGQVKLLEKEIWGIRGISTQLRIETADSFQGEENNIILLSLVRSNSHGTIGFMETDNRICVALSRAKHGLYIVGNISTLASTSKTWEAIRVKLEEKGCIGPKLKLVCSKHETPVETEVSTGAELTRMVFNGCRICKALRIGEIPSPPTTNEQLQLVAPVVENDIENEGQDEKVATTMGFGGEEGEEVKATNTEENLDTQRDRIRHRYFRTLNLQ